MNLNNLKQICRYKTAVYAAGRCDVLSNPPDEDSLCDDMEFELFGEEPLDSFLVQPSDTAK